MKASDLAAIAARHRDAYHPTVGIVEPMWMPSPGGHLVKLSEGEWQFYLASQTDVPALLAEVQRLKGLVEAAYTEGAHDRAHVGKWDAFWWDVSKSKRLLDGGTDDR